MRFLFYRIGMINGEVIATFLSVLDANSARSGTGTGMAGCMCGDSIRVMLTFCTELTCWQYGIAI
jgi:hypothetical protein